MNLIQKQDINEFVASFTLGKELQGSCFLITGATGLIGSSLIHCLFALDRDIRIIAPVRNKVKAEKMFEGQLENLQIVEADLLQYDYNDIGTVDYIIHCAAPTSSRFFVDYPVETFDIIYNGSLLLLEYARKNPIKGFVYLSSLEVYGSVSDDSILIKENYQGYVDPMSVRSSYPMAKRAVECLCCSYAAEYKVPVMVARLTQTTGAGIDVNDNRVIAQFARLAAKGNDIILHTAGESARPYCYTMDGVTAILFILLKGKAGEAYNVANENTYISVIDMAKYLCDVFNFNINIRKEPQINMGYAPITRLRLSTEKLRNLGWMPKYGLKDIFIKLIAYLS